MKTLMLKIEQSRLQTDVLALVPLMNEALEHKESGEMPQTFSDIISGVCGISTVLVNAIERHIIDHNTQISNEVLVSFITVYSQGGFILECDWEESPIPVSAPGIMILDPAYVVSQLKKMPWRKANVFIGNRDVAFAFSSYELKGTALDLLKKKYATNKNEVGAKWEELIAWVAQQKGE